jgi:uncharacterized protein YbjT (DUF2867 family)
MTYVVAGVTGQTGRVVAETLLAEGRKVRVIVRDAAKGEPFRAKGAEVAVADIANEAALTKALEGAEGAYLLVPPSMREKDYRAYEDGIVDAIVGAVRAAKVPHVVLLSSVGAQHAAGTGPIAAMHRAEKLLATVPGTKATFIRAAYFMENLGGSLGTLGQGFIPTFFAKDLAIPMIATADIGKVAAKALVEGAKETSIIELAGPEVSASQVAETLARITGKPVAVQEAPLDAVVPTFTGFGMSESLATMYREMIAAVTSGLVAFEGGHRRAQGTTSVETVLRGLLGRA